MLGLNLRRTKAMAYKEVLHILRDPRSLYMALALPLLLLLLFGYALSLDVDQVPTVVYDLDRSSESRELLEQFRGSRYFQIVKVAEDEARAAGCEWLHVDFEPSLRQFYLDACGFGSTPAGVIQLT